MVSGWTVVGFCNDHRGGGTGRLNRRIQPGPTLFHENHHGDCPRRNSRKRNF
jgi:hypothetical protein